MTICHKDNATPHKPHWFFIWAAKIDKLVAELLSTKTEKREQECGYFRWQQVAAATQHNKLSCYIDFPLEIVYWCNNRLLHDCNNRLLHDCNNRLLHDTYCISIIPSNQSMKMCHQKNFI